MDNSDEPEDLLDGKIVFQKNKDRTFSKTKVICTLCEKTLSFHRSNTRLTTATRSMCWSARGVQVECAKPDSLAGRIVQKKRMEEPFHPSCCLLLPFPPFFTRPPARVVTVQREDYCSTY
ncbi:unnamed protein product [Pleuronectes platessa]|uniref:Uncharacterized protein n=1 Tax=Pleuronectes platessa TaxID=8262 RepID=A0A9N7YYA6_PLEPL|nr:unnamed protein product [Pleuronectes platessa]